MNVMKEKKKKKTIFKYIIVTCFKFSWSRNKLLKDFAWCCDGAWTKKIIINTV